MLSRRVDFCRLGRRVDDEGPIRHWLHLDRLFEKTTKQKPPKLRAAAIEAKGELVEIRLEMVRLDGPLMGPEQPSFEKTCDAVHTGQGYMGRIAGFGDDMWLVPVVFANRRRIRRQTVGDDDGAWHDTVKQKQAKCGRLSVGNDTQAASPEALGAKQLNGYRNQSFALRAASPLPGANTANERLVNFDCSCEPITAGAYHRRSETVQHRPGCLVGTEAEDSMESFGRDTILRGSHVPGGGEPHRQGGAGSVEDGPRGYRDSLLAAVTPETAIAHPPTTWSLAARAYKPFRPAKPFEVVEAGGIIREPCPQLRIVARIVASRSQLGGRRYRRHPYILYLQHSDGHPP